MESTPHFRVLVVDDDEDHRYLSRRRLEMAGVEEIAADGQTFDPSLHEAISEAPGDPNKVVSVVQKGYKLGERVIRPAMVIVGKGGGEGEQGGSD